MARPGLLLVDWVDGANFNGVLGEIGRGCESVRFLAEASVAFSFPVLRDVLDVEVIHENKERTPWVLARMVMCGLRKYRNSSSSLDMTLPSH